MDFLKKIFGGNSANPISANQENFVVDETGNAKEASSVMPTKISTPVSQPEPVAHITTPTPAPISNPVPIVEPTTPTTPKSPVTETATPSDGEYVGDTSAFDELMKQAESSVDARVLDQPVLDPEFQKAKNELESEGNIEIFPTQ